MRRRNPGAVGRLRRPRRRLREDRAAVSDVLGSLLLVGITVMSAVGLGIMLLSFDGPSDRLQADLAFRTDPGTGGWGTGDETLQILHLGGEPVPADGLVVRFTRGGTESCYGDASGCLALASAFADGELTIGETWESSTALTLAKDTSLDVSVILIGEVSQLLAAGSVSGSQDPDVVDCLVDTSAPDGRFEADDLATTQGTAALTVTLEAEDFCGMVDVTILPNLHYRVTPALAGVPDEFTDAGSDLGDMAFVSGTSFVLDIPAPSGLGWAAAYGRTLEFYASGLTDNAPIPNVGDTAVESDLIQVIGASASPPSAVTLSAGLFTAAGPSSALNTNNGANAILQESCMLDQPSVLNVQNLCGTLAGGVSVTNAANALFSDNVRSTHSGSNSYVEVSGFSIPGVSGDVNSFSVVWEGSRQSGGSAPTLALEVNFGPDYSATSSNWKQVGTTLSPGTSEGTSVAIVLAGGTAGGPWTDEQFSNLHVRARVNNGSTRTVSTDDLHVRPTYPATTTVRDLDVQFAWAHSALAADSVIRQLQMEYQVTSPESYTVEVAQDSGGAAWTSCPSLTSTTLVAYTCDLTKAQVEAGPLVRIRGAATSDTALPASLQFDYVHMLVVQ